VKEPSKIDEHFKKAHFQQSVKRRHCAVRILTQLGDSGMACYLLGIRTASELERSPFLGSLFEGFIASEILKSQLNRGLRREIYYFRDQQGLEVDFLLPRQNAELWLIEAKAGKTVQTRMAAPLLSLESALGKQSRRLLIVHRKPQRSVGTTAIAKGVEALDVEQFSKQLVRD